MDGTITLTEPFHYRAFAAVFKEQGIEYPFEEHLAKYAAAGAHKTFKGVFADRGRAISNEDIERCIAKKREVYEEIIKTAQIEVVPGIIEFVRKIEEAGIAKIIATGNSNLDSVRFILDKVGLLEYFPNIISAAEVKRGKPFPDVFLEASRRIAVKSSLCMVFEDSINGVKAAKAAGMECVGIATTASREVLENAGADRVIKDYKDCAILAH